MIHVSKSVKRSAEDYVDALIDACGKGGGVNPVDVLIETAAYPKVTREIEMAEFIVGWFHGVAESLDIEVDNRKAMGALWDHLAGGKVPVAAAPAKRPAKVKPPVIPNMPREGYGSPAVGALTGKRSRKAEDHRPHPPKRAPREVAAPAPKATGKTTIVEMNAHASFTAAGMGPTPPSMMPSSTRARRKRTPAAQTALPMESAPPPPADAATHAAAGAQLAAMRKQRAPRPMRNG